MTKYNIMKLNRNGKDSKLIAQYDTEIEAISSVAELRRNEPDGKYYIPYAKKVEKYEDVKVEDIKIAMSLNNVLSFLGLLCILEADYKKSDNNDILNVIEELKRVIKLGLNNNE